MGDLADMPSLSGYDRGKKCFQGRTYKADIETSLDFNEKLWSAIRKRKRRLPRRRILRGNHEERIARAIQLSPELEGAIGYGDLEWERWYDTIVDYNGNTPGTIVLDGVHYAHYFISGIMGRPIGGEHPAYSLCSKLHISCTAAHSHVVDWCVRTRADGVKVMVMIAGCYFDFPLEYAGETNKLFWPGVIIKRNVENGVYDPEFISLARLKKEYGPS